jgi:hypothetical protein
MAKKIKNIKKKEATKKKQNSENLLNSLNMKLSNDVLSIVIILKDLNPTILNNQCFSQINNVCKNLGVVDIGVITHDQTNASFLLCPVLNLHIIKQLTYPIISTNISTTLTALSSKSNNIYYYIFDIENIPREILNSKRIKFVVKNNGILDILTKMYNIDKIEIIENFFMVDFIKLINKDIKNEEKGNN